MKKPAKATIEVKGVEVTILSTAEGDYISLTDMLKAKDGDFFISDWLRNRNTVAFLGIWETVHNPDFNSGEFAIIKSQAGLNSYKLSVKEWVEKTNAIGLRATAGRYGGTFAHHDIAFDKRIIEACNDFVIDDNCAFIEPRKQLIIAPQHIPQFLEIVHIHMPRLTRQRS